MAAGQLLLGVADTIPLAVTARVLVGAGDALTFISVLSVVTAWFPPRRVPLMTQLTGLLGQSGQVLSALPFAALLHGPGWSTAFVSAAALGAAVALAVLAVVRNRPAGAPAPPPAPSPRQVLAGLVASWKEPGTRLGLWTHTGTQFSGTVFALLWGVPYLVAGQGLSATAASALLTLFVLVGVATGPVFGVFTARHPLRRSWLVLGVIVLTVLTWTAVLLVPPPAPPWLLVVLVLVLALGGPGSMIGFDYARTFNPAARIGVATGIVNGGGFAATMSLIALIAVFRPDLFLFVASVFGESALGYLALLGNQVAGSVLGETALGYVASGSALGAAVIGSFSVGAIATTALLRAAANRRAA